MRRCRSGVALLAAALCTAGSAYAGPTPKRFATPFLPKDPAALSAAKQRAHARLMFANPFSAQRSAGGHEPSAVVFGNLNQPGLAAGDNTMANDGSPPDPTGAVGPGHYVEFVNSKVGVYSKTDLSQVSSADLDTFVGDAGNVVFDPQIQWDQQGQRWFYLADDCSNNDCSGTNNLAYGFSKSTDPSDLASGWCNYFIRTDNKGGVGLFDDYPKLGHNNTHLIFGTNVFLGTAFVSSRVWTVPKPAPGTLGSCPVAATPHYFSGTAASPTEDGTLLLDPLETSDGQLAFTPVPANTTDSSANGYVVAAHDPTGTKIMAWHVNSSGSLVADGDITVSSFGMPAPVPQPRTTDPLDSLDTRLTQAVAHADPDAGGAEAVWTQHTIAGGGGSVVRWYELLPATTTRRQEGNVSITGNFVFNGSISPSMTGNEAVVQYNVGGSSTLAQIRASSRVGGSPLGTMGGELLLGQSTNADQDFTCPSNDPTSDVCRWGDYSAVSPDPDPANQHIVWGTNQLLGPPRSPADEPHWVTRNFALKANAPPVASFTATPSSVSRGQAVTFDASASHDVEPGSGIATYAWDFDGNGSTDQTTTSPTVTFAYSSLGTFTPQLVVTDSDDGLSSAATGQTIIVQNAFPTARISFAPTAPLARQAISFSAAGSGDPDGSIARYLWDLDGDGVFETNTGTTPSASHTYSAARTLNVTLRVEDNDGAVATSTVTVPVRLFRVTLKLPRKARRAALLKGLKGSARCGRACTVKLMVRIPRKLAKQLKTKSVVGTMTLRITRSAAKPFKLKLKKGAKRALKRTKKPFVLTVVAAAKEPTGPRASAKRTVKIRP